jgi:nucleoside 2-deoxyribosyltransferase
LTPSPAEVRRQIEEAAQAALDTADRLIAILDSMEEDTAMG